MTSFARMFASPAPSDAETLSQYTYWRLFSIFSLWRKNGVDLFCPFASLVGLTADKSQCAINTHAACNSEPHRSLLLYFTSATLPLHPYKQIMLQTITETKDQFLFQGDANRLRRC